MTVNTILITVSTDGPEWLLKISLGIAIYPVYNQSPDILINLADKAMYNIKSRKVERGDKF